MISDQEKKLAEQVIKLHDGKSYHLLREMSSPSSPPDSEGMIPEEMYDRACEEILQQLGEVTHIEFIDGLQRKESQLSLWKAKYTHSEDEVFWAIGFDREAHKVREVLVNW